ncbi:MAG: hypothetical protein MPJ24_09235 [Pirellulaceae bacterium]|nr:hypothetical protein [Pirellulaceae bacterium]
MADHPKLSQYVIKLRRWQIRCVAMSMPATLLFLLGGVWESILTVAISGALLFLLLCVIFGIGIHLWWRG